MLPEGATFATVLAGVDEFHMTTIEPGFAFGFTIFDLRVDNVSVLPVPEPTTTFFLLATFLIFVAKRRGADPHR